MRKAALHNLGCKVNSYETEAMTQLLKKAGYEIVSGRRLYYKYMLCYKYGRQKIKTDAS